MASEISKLSDFKDGQKGILKSIDDDAIATKLISMGMLPGKIIELVRRIPFGGGIYVKVEDMVMALRIVEADHIIVEDL